MTTELDSLLEKTSRTFAVAIPLLPAPPRLEVTTAYLLFRIADTFEDATRWSRAKRLAALHDFAECVAEPSATVISACAERWMAEPPCDHAGYLELLEKAPLVLQTLASFAPSRRAIVIRHTLRTIEGMAEIVARSSESGSLQLRDVSDLRQYCYIVAGIVGELLTDLFLDTAPALVSVRSALEANARAFGEGLQLVNILKDAEDDASEGRRYISDSMDRAALFDLARQDLRAAATYVLAMQTAGAPRGCVAFVTFPVLLARESLDRIERAGAGSKVGRDVVARLLRNMHGALDEGRPALSM